ncbi:MAG: hypothetical protein KGL39_02910 [Patescibacteria group bacterium]|nr:hypothetical protein [Patescibacteria group bacterium]
MKKTLLILLFVLASVTARAQYTVSNLDATKDTNWPTIVIPHINTNYAAIVSALNQLYATNNYLLTQNSNLWAQLTNLPGQAPRGTYYPSNTWSLLSVTNTMKNFSFWEGNSNGNAFVSLYLSNGNVYIKQLQP